jgi:hypothetical protein
MNEQKEEKIYKLDKKFYSFINELTNETDRAAVILGVAKLDLLLYQILQKHFVPIPGSKDEFLNNDGPLSTFSAKIHMANRLGLIDNLFSRSLHLIRKIRNDFAHEVEGCLLGSSPYRDRIRALIAPIKDLEAFKYICSVYKQSGKLTSSSIYFRVTIGNIVIDLENLYMNCNLLEGKYALDLLHAAKNVVPKTISETNKP